MPVDPQFRIVMGPATLARELWRFGEDELWQRALLLSPEVMLQLAPAFGWLAKHPRSLEAIWHDPPPYGAVLVRAIEYLEGAPRAPARRRRRPERDLPTELQLSEEALYADMRRVDILTS